MSEENEVFTDDELFIAQELWALVEQARKRGALI